MSRTLNEALTDAGFVYELPEGETVGYWSFKFAEFELTLEPLILDAGDYALALYHDHELEFDEKLLVDVKTRPSS